MLLSEERQESEKSVAERLPELTEAEHKKATTPESVSWIQNLTNQSAGYIWFDYEHTHTVLLTVSENTMRCIRVFDYEAGYWLLSMIRASCIAAGITLEVEGHTVVAPLPRALAETDVNNCEEEYRGWV